MGMSASQARLIQLEARQSNLEYQGQQINQERSILSQQCTDLYNSLLTMQVPTPPSTQDYTTVQYTGLDGASSFNLGNIVPTGTTYTVEMNYRKTGHFLQEKGTAAVTNIPAKIGLATANLPSIVSAIKAPASTIGENKNVADGNWIMHNVGNDIPTNTQDVYILDESTNQFVKISSDDSRYADANVSKYVLKQAQNEKDAVGNEGDNDYQPAVDQNYDPQKDYDMGTKKPVENITGGSTKNSIINGDYLGLLSSSNTPVRIDGSNFDTFFEQVGVDTGIYKPKSGVTINTATEATDDNSYTNPDVPKDGGGYYVEGKLCYSLSNAQTAGRIGSSDTYKAYIEAIKDAYPEYAEKSNEDIEADFKVYFTKNDSGLQVPHFVMTSDLTSGQTDVSGSKYVTTFDYVANGSYTSTVKQNDCTLTFDASGRITAIGIPRYNDKKEIIGYKQVELEASKVTDEAAYKDAYAKYEYSMYEYDKQQQEINAKTEVIQQQDRNLELKLQRLDNERQQITTEIEAVQKVIDDNIEASYKTFSG